MYYLKYKIVEMLSVDIETNSFADIRPGLRCMGNFSSSVMKQKCSTCSKSNVRVAKMEIHIKFIELKKNPKSF